MNKELKLAHLGFVAVMFVVICIAFAGCTTPASNAPAPVQPAAPAAPIQTAVPLVSGQVTAPAEPAHEGGKLAQALGSAVKGQTEQMDTSVAGSVERGENNPTAAGLEPIPDLPFKQLYAMSNPQIFAKGDLVLALMAIRSYPGHLMYSPVTAYLAADDWGFTAERYLDKISNIKGEDDNAELSRIAYLKYLEINKNAAYSIRDAAISESEGNYKQAAVNAKMALEYLEGIKQLPEQNPKSTLNRLKAYLTYYKYLMEKQDNVPSH